MKMSPSVVAVAQPRLPDMETLRMSQQERKRMVVLSQVQQGRLRLRAAAEVMALSYRQAKRVWKRYQASGEAGLVHRSRGQPGRRAKPAKDRERILRRYQERYPDFGPTLAAEKLQEEGWVVDHETLRRWLLVKGLWRVGRRRQQHRQWRERKACFGAMVQLDGSHHDWFEGRRGKCVLMVMVDDATNRTQAWFYEEETTEASYGVFEHWARTHGLPQALYVDRDSIYRCERLPTVSEQVAGQEPQTQFGRAMKQLGVRLILANSPQAKGRVERRNQLFQDRLVKEMRLAGIRDLKAANEFLAGRFLPLINRRFVVTASDPADVHQAIGQPLDKVLSWEETRVVQRDWTVSWRGRWFQITRQEQAHSLAGKKVVVRQRRDGRVEAEWRGRVLKWKELPGRPVKAPAPTENPKLGKPPKPPGLQHPWRRFGGAVGRPWRRNMKDRGRSRRLGSGTPVGLRFAPASLRPRPQTQSTSTHQPV